MKKLKNFVANTSNHQQEIVDTKNKRNAYHQKSDSINNKINMLLQNRYYNSPSSLIEVSNQMKSSNNRIQSAYRRSDGSCNSSGKHNPSSSQPHNEFSKSNQMSEHIIIKNAKVNISMKNSKSESKNWRKNIGKLKVRAQEVQPYPKNSNSHFIVGNASNVVNQKTQQNLFSYPLNPAQMKQNTDVEDHIIEGKIDWLNFRRGKWRNRWNLSTCRKFSTNGSKFKRTSTFKGS